MSGSSGFSTILYSEEMVENFPMCSACLAKDHNWPSSHPTLSFPMMQTNTTVKMTSEICSFIPDSFISWVQQLVIKSSRKPLPLYALQVCHIQYIPNSSIISLDSRLAAPNLLNCPCLNIRVPIWYFIFPLKIA